MTAPHRAIPADEPADQSVCHRCGREIVLSEWDEAPCHDIDYLLDPDPSVSMPSGVDYAQARAIRAATTHATYSNGDWDFIVVATRLGGPIDEGDDGWFIDYQWVRFIQYEYDRWMFISGTGDNDAGGGGPWFAQWLRHPDFDPNDPGIWVAVGMRPSSDEENGDDEA